MSDKEVKCVECAKVIPVEKACKDFQGKFRCPVCNWLKIGLIRGALSAKDVELWQHKLP